MESEHAPVAFEPTPVPVGDAGRVASPHRVRRFGWPLGWLIACAVMAALGAYHWGVYVSQPTLTHSFAFVDRLFELGVAASILGVGALVGLRVLGLLRSNVLSGRGERAALATGLGLGMVGLGVLALGMLHLYYPVTFVVLLAGLPWLFPVERRWLGALLRDLPSALRRFLRAGPTALDWAARLSLAAVSVAVVLLTFCRDMTLPPAGPGGYDTYQYHWAVPLLLLREHGMRGIPGWAHANLPFGTEMLNLIALSLQAPHAALYVLDSFAVLAVVLLFGLIRRHFGTSVAWFGVAAFATTPLLIAFASQGYVETALIFYTVATLAVLVAWLESIPATRGLARGPLLVAGACVGLGISVKYTAIEYLPGVVALVLAGVGYVAWRERRTVPLRRLLASASVRVGGFALAALLVFAPWVLKNWLLLGNPVYPALASIFPTPLWSPIRDQTLAATFHHFGAHSELAQRYHLAAIDLFLHTARYGEGTAFPVGLLARGVVLVVPFVAVAWWTLRTRRGAPSACSAGGQLLVVGGLVLLCLSMLAVWDVSGALVERYALPPIVLMTVLGAVLLGWLAQRLASLASLASRSATPRWRPLGVLAWLALGVELLVCSNYVRLPLLEDTRNARNPLPLLTARTSEYSSFRTWGDFPPDFWAMTDYVNTTVPRDGTLLMLGRGTGEFFANRDYIADSGGEWVPYLMDTGKTPDGVLRVLQAQHVTYVVYDAKLMRWLTHTYENHLLASYLPAYLAFAQQKLLQVAQWGDFALYRVPPAAPSATAVVAAPDCLSHPPAHITCPMDYAGRRPQAWTRVKVMPQRSGSRRSAAARSSS